VQQRTVAGARYEITTHQALKLELGSAEVLDDRFRQVTLQWSAGFP
jgi:hypothetical protein